MTDSSEKLLLMYCSRWQIPNKLKGFMDKTPDIRTDK